MCGTAGKLDKDGGEKLGQVSVQAAFESPDTLASAMDFLRQYAADTESQAAVAVVPKHRIAYPQVHPLPFLSISAFMHTIETSLLC